MSEMIDAVLEHVADFFKLSRYQVNFFRKEKGDMTYQETKDYFNSGKGYLNNLSDEEKKKILLKSDLKSYLS